MQERRTRHVLIVDDVPDQRTIYRALLERRGYSVTEAEDGESAVRLAEADRPDLILMDVGLPWMDGWEVTRRLKTVPRTAGIPVIAVSAQVGREGQDRAAEAGCARFLAKTEDPKNLVEIVCELIGDPMLHPPS